MRQHTNYSDSGEAKKFAGARIDQPVAGLYRMRLRSKGIRVGIRLWYGPPNDPHTGEIMDRAPRWQVDVNGETDMIGSIDRYWPQCSGEPIDEAEYQYLIGLQKWGEDNAPGSAIADPTRPVDLFDMPISF